MKKHTDEAVVKLFLDSNVILSGLISGKGAPRIILDILCLKFPFLAAITCRYNIIEIERNLKKKIPGAIPLYKQYLPRLNLEIAPLPSASAVKKYSRFINGKDAPVLASAACNKVDFLITGDKKDFSKIKKSAALPFMIITPSEFIDIILPGLLRRKRQYH